MEIKKYVAEGHEHTMSDITDMNLLNTINNI